MYILDEKEKKNGKRMELSPALKEGKLVDGLKNLFSELEH